MADLLAIVSHDPAVPLAATELDSFEQTFESLRGQPERRQRVAADWLGVAVLGRPGAPTGGILRQEDGWTAWAGSLRPSPAEMAGPLNQLDGQFALVRLDDRATTLTVAADPLGMKPFYAASKGGKTYLSTSSLVLARHLGAPPSRQGIEVFLRSGLQFGQRTAWSGIERLRPAEWRELSPRGQRGGVYWQPEIDQSVDRLSLREAAAACVESASQGLFARYGANETWIDLTGGFDSRLLTLLAREAGVPFITNTVGAEGDEDVRIASGVARAAGWRWRQIDSSETWPQETPAALEEALAWGDGQLDALALTGVISGHRRKGIEGPESLLTGGGGELFRDHPWSHELLAAGRSTRVRYDRLLAWRILLATDLSALRSDPTGVATEVLREELEWRARPFSSYPNTFQDDLLYAYKMTGHSGAYQAAAGAWIDMEIPFYLRPTLSVAISSSPRHRRFHRLMRTMLEILDPALAALPTETGGPAGRLRPANAYRFAPYPWRRAQRFAHRLGGRLGRTPAAPPSPRQLAYGALLASLRAEGRLDPARMRSAPLYDEGRLEALISRAIATPAAVDWGMLGRIVTAELALEKVDSGLSGGGG